MRKHKKEKKRRNGKNEVEKGTKDSYLEGG